MQERFYCKKGFRYILLSIDLVDENANIPGKKYLTLKIVRKKLNGEGTPSINKDKLGKFIKN